jgi:hypothetical protein
VFSSKKEGNPMSHVAKIELEITDLDALKAACQRLGLEFRCGQVVYAWYGEYMADYPLPEGLTAKDLGKCDHAIRVPGASYEIGVLKRNGKYHLLWDFWSEGGLQCILGKNAGRLRQAYAIERTRREALRKGYRITESKTQNGLRLVLTA